MAASDDGDARGWEGHPGFVAMNARNRNGPHRIRRRKHRHLLKPTRKRHALWRRDGIAR